MDERLKGIMDNFESMKIRVDDTFKFHCKMCGNCCINMEDILLSPKDIYNMSKELGLATVDFFDKFCEGFVGGDSRVPLVRLKPKGSDRRCPLLKKAKCRVHRSKPTVCAMFPIGRVVVARDMKEGLKNVSQEQVQYLFTNPGCGDESEIHTVKEWLESFGIPVPDEFFLAWQQTVLDMGDVFRTIERGMSRNVMEQIWNVVFAGVYLSYDLEKEFFSQFEDNTKKFFELMNSAFSLGGGSPIE